MAVEDLRAAWEAGDDLDELSSYLCRDRQEVATKCKKLGLDLVYQSSNRSEQEKRKQRQMRSKPCPSCALSKSDFRPSRFIYPGDLADSAIAERVAKILCARRTVDARSTLTKKQTPLVLRHEHRMPGDSAPSKHSCYLCDCPNPKEPLY